MMHLRARECRSHAVLFLVCLLAVLRVCRATAAATPPPPREPPQDMADLFTLGGSVPLEYMYVDDTNEGSGTHYAYPASTVDSYVQSVQQQVNYFRLKSKSVDADADVDAGAGAGAGADSDADAAQAPMPATPPPNKKYWPMYALSRYADSHIENKDVAIFGSIDPYIEAIVFALGARKVVTFEYNELTIVRPGVWEGVTSKAYKRLLDVFHHKKDDDRVCPPNKDTDADDADASSASTHEYASKFDTVVSFSSFDHSGLGRYGDPLNPQGDLEAMKFAKSVLKKGGEGVFLLTVPVGPDVVVFNLHRRYGETRLPMLLDGFSRKEVLFWDDELLTKEANWRQTYEPVFVLTA